MLRFKSTLSRIMFLHVAAMAITAIFMPLVLYWFLSSNVEVLRRRALEEQADVLSGQLVRRPEGDWSLDLPDSLRGQYAEVYGRYAYAVLDAAGQVLFSSAKDRLPVFETDDRSSDADFLQVRHGDRIVSGVSLRKELDGRIVRVQVGEDLGHRDVLVDDVVANLFPQIAWITAPILLLLLATDLIIFRRAVQPLLRASDRAEHISPTRMDVRLPIDDIPTEIGPLVIAINKALDRLECGFRRQSEFAADAAHELRTPLAILRTRLETLPDKGAAGKLLRDVDNMVRVVNQLLDAAELETIVIDPADRVDLRQVCADVAEFIAPLALAQDKTIALSGTERPVWIKGHAEMLRRAVRNLVENALNHAPEGTDVEIVVEEKGTVGVLDQGQGVPVANREAIFERFWRRERRRADGAGLGLSIVKRIVETHGGSISVENRPAGGAVFQMRLPLAEQ